MAGSMAPAVAPSAVTSVLSPIVASFTRTVRFGRFVTSGMALARSVYSIRFNGSTPLCSRASTAGPAAFDSTRRSN